MSVKKGGRPRPRGRVVWDEDNLDYLEANRSPKRKITEPKTPYHPPEDSDGTISPIPEDGDERKVQADTAVDPEAVKSALSEVASGSGNGKRCRRHCGWTSSEDEVDDEHQQKDPEQHQRFAEHRRAHYDEFRRLKLLRSQQGSEWQEEDEEKNANEKARGDQDLADAVCAIDIQASSSPMQS